MRVLQIGLSSTMGGIESFALNYFREISKYDVIFDFVDIYGDGIAGSQEINSLGGKIITLPNFKRHPFSFTYQLTKYLNSNNYDAVHVNIQTAANILPAISSKLAGYKPILHSHTVNAEGFIRKILDKLNRILLYSIPATYLACGTESGKWMWGKRPFQVLPNAVDTKKFAFNLERRNELRKQLNLADNTTLFGFVGRLEPVKNPLFALNLLYSFNTKSNNKAKLLILGNGTLEQEILSKAKLLNIEKDLIMLGFTPNVSDYLSAIDFFVMPSLHEAFSLAAIEAQINGLPCLLSDTIPKEMKISNLVKFCSLSVLNDWIAEIEEFQMNNFVRTESRLIDNKKYDIKECVKKLLQIYKQ